jgi:hypothetical protein
MGLNMKGKKARVIGFAILSLILVIFVFYKLFINQIVLSAINNYFQKNLGSSVSAVSCDFSIFSLRFSMEQPVVRALGKGPGHAFLKAEKILIGVTPDLILGRKIHFGRILFLKPQVLVEILKDGSTNLPIIKQSSEASPIPELIINQLSFKELELFFRNDINKSTLLSPLLNVEMELKENSDHRLSVDSSGKGEFFFNGKGRAINKLRLDGLINHERLLIAQALIQIEKSNMDISGTLNNWLSAQLNLLVKGNIYPEEYADLITPGNADFEQARLGQLRFGLQLIRDQKILEIREIHASGLRGEILGHAEFSRRAGEKPNHLFFKWQDLDFSLIKGVLPINLFACGSGNTDLSFSDFKLSEIKGTLDAQFKPKTLSPHNQNGVPLAGDLKLDFLQGTIFVKKMSLQSQGNNIKGELNIDKDNISGFINGRIGHLRGIMLFLSPFNDGFRLLAENKIDGEMVIAGNISGTMAKPDLRVDFTQGKIKNLTRSPLDFKGSLIFKNRVFRIENIRISQPWGVAVLNGTIPGGSTGKEMDLEVRASQLDLTRLSKELPFALPPMQGMGEFNIRLTQKTDAPFLSNHRLEGNFSFTNFYFAQMQLGTVQGKLSSAKENIIFLMQIPSSHSEISGATDLHEPFQTKIDFSIRNGQIGEFLKLLPFSFQDGLSGAITCEAQATFLPLKFRESLQISFAASDLLLTRGGQTILDKKPLRLAYRSGGLIVESVSLLLDQMEINASGELPCKPKSGKEINIMAKGGGNFLSVFLPDLLFEGNLDAKLAIKGSLTNPVFSGSVQVEQGRLPLFSQNLPLTNIKLQLELKDNLMILHALSFNIKEGEVIGKGTLPLPFLKLPIQNSSASRIDEVYNVDLTLAHCPMAILQTFLIGAFPKNTTGDISGNIHLKGKNSDLSDLACAATITLDDLSINGRHFFLAEPIKLISNENGIVLQEVVLKGQDDLRLAIKGSYDLKKEKPLDFSMQGKLDSQVLFGFFPELAGSGRIVFELSIGGTIKDMEWNGKIEAVNNELQFRAGDLFINQLNCVANINNHYFTIERLTGSLNGGTIELKGLVGLENTKQPAADLQVKLADINLNFPKGLFTNLSGQLNLLSADKEYLLKGNMDMNNGKYNESFNVGSYLYEFLFNRKETIIESGDTDLKKRIKFNINLQTPQALVVDNNVCKQDIFNRKRPDQFCQP